MRIDVRKFLFLGSESDRKVFFEKAQQFGIIHFIDSHPQQIKEVPEILHQYVAAIKVLRGLPSVDQVEPDDFSHADNYVKRILALQHLLHNLEEERRVVRLEITRVEVFGDFSLSDIAYVEKEGKRKVQFFAAKPGLAQALSHDKLIYIGTESNLDYFVAINPQHKQYQGMFEVHIDHPVGELHKKLGEIEREIDSIQHELKTYAKYNRYLHHALTHKMNSVTLTEALNTVETPAEGKLFAVQGWVPESKLDELQKLLDDQSVYAEEVSIEPKDEVPTFLENVGAHRIGEDLVNIFDTPSAKDKDPSMWVLCFFALFFAMIVNDGGYGLVWLSIAGFLWWKFPKIEGIGRRTLKLFTMLSIACIIWGVLANSFFGIEPAHGSFLRQLSVVDWLVNKKAEYHFARHDAIYQGWVKQIPALADAKDAHEFLAKGIAVRGGHEQPVVVMQFTDLVLFELALFVGCIHIILSMARYLGRHWSHLGWMIAIVGAYMFLTGYLQATSLIYYVFHFDPVKSTSIGKQMLMGGAALALILAVIQHKLGGLAEIMVLVEVFGDVLSYLRLYALGLAGAIVASVINEMGMELPIIVGIFVMLIGHTVNMGLGVMNGVIHGLRLNFLEWYHYSFEGGGKPFKPLKLFKKE